MVAPLICILLKQEDCTRYFSYFATFISMKAYVLDHLDLLQAIVPATQLYARH